MISSHWIIFGVCYLIVCGDVLLHLSTALHEATPQKHLLALSHVPDHPHLNTLSPAGESFLSLL